MLNCILALSAFAIISQASNDSKCTEKRVLFAKLKVKFEPSYILKCRPTNIKWKVHLTNSSLPPNFMYWAKWLFYRNDSLPHITFIFIGRRNPGNVRFMSLYSESVATRVVYMRGSRLKGLDRILLNIFRYFCNFAIPRCGDYSRLDELSVPNFKSGSVNRLLHIDDPLYSAREIASILNWEKVHSDAGCKTHIVCTSEFTQRWLGSFITRSSLEIIEQGFIKIPEDKNEDKFTEFACAYSSPFIDGRGDKNESHSTWGALTLIEEIVPRIFSHDNKLRIHLIGKVGNRARKALGRYPNVVLHGQLSPLQTANILKKCHVGIYPRKTDHFRRVLKIYDYIGAGLPIVTFALEDTKLVFEECLGFSVMDSDSFVDAILEMKRNVQRYEEFSSNIIKARFNRDWKSLAKKLDVIGIPK